VTQATIDEHRAIYLALKAGDPSVATAAALLHVNTSESWLRALLGA
jgi:GntR family transcriptional repressor for pyruvate dehydrogenase complex